MVKARIKIIKLPKNFFAWLVVLGLLVWAAFGFYAAQKGPETPPAPLSKAIELIKQNQVKKITVADSLITLQLKDGSEILSQKEPQESLTELLAAHGIDPEALGAEVVVKNPPPSSFLSDLALGVIPVILMAALFFWIFRQARGAGTEILSIGKSTARLFAKGAGGKKITFDDAAGVDEAKQELKEIVDFLKNPQKYRKLGARIPKGVLLVGPAGTGKTLLSRAIANEAGVPFFSMAGSEFMEMLVGVGPSRVRDLFSTAKKSAPSLIFVDEIEAIGRQRGMGVGGGHDEREQTLNQILVEMDGFDPNTNVIVLAASNRPELLDPALTRPGRFDRRIVLDLPDIKGRGDIIKIHMRGKPFDAGVDIEKIARRTVGFSGADIENMLNEAAILAAREGRKAITMGDIEEAATKVKLGPERKRLQSEEDKRMTAYHEAGHALVAAQLPQMDPVHRVSIVSRGLALGFTMIPPAKDRYNETKTRLLSQIAALLGGRAAEELEFAEMTVGAASDLKRASQIARAMVTEFGMGRLGPISFAPDIGEEVRWPYRLPFEGSEHSEQMAAKIDEEVKRIMDECYKRAQNLLKEKKEKLDLVAEALVRKETLEGEEFEGLIN